MPVYRKAMGMKLDHNAVVRALDWSYDKAIDGVPGFGTAEEMARDYLKGSASLEEKADELIQWQVAKAATSGFLSGLGGVLTLPVTIPANLSTVWYVQIRMVAALAYMGGHDILDDRVKAMCYVCLCGNGAEEVLKRVGIQTGKKLAEQGIKHLPFAAIKAINQAVGFRLITKFGTTGAINLGKAVPVVGGVVGGTFDGATTRVVGKVAKKHFILS